VPTEEQFNPLDWLRSAQDWFAKTEKSSGFRPYLIFCLLVFGLVVVLLTAFRDVQLVVQVALAVLGLVVIGFIVLFAVKAVSDPDFCRSETHIERLKKIEVEQLGSESNRLDADVAERKMLTEAEPDTPRLSNPPPSVGGTAQ
jgi:hypothetical protein